MRADFIIAHIRLSPLLPCYSLKGQRQLFVICIVFDSAHSFYDFKTDYFSLNSKSLKSKLVVKLFFSVNQQDFHTDFTVVCDLELKTGLETRRKYQGKEAVLQRLT